MSYAAPNPTADATALLSVVQLGALQFGPAREAVDLLTDMGAAAVPALVRALGRRRRGPLVRSVAAWLLGRVGGRRALEALCAARQDGDGDVAVTVREALERLGAHAEPPCAAAA